MVIKLTCLLQMLQTTLYNGYVAFFNIGFVQIFMYHVHLVNISCYIQHLFCYISCYIVVFLHNIASYLALYVTYCIVVSQGRIAML